MPRLVGRSSVDLDRGRQADHRTGRMARLVAVDPVGSRRICADPIQVVRRGISGDPTRVVRRVTGMTRVVGRVTGVARVVRRVTGMTRVGPVTGVTRVVGGMTGVAVTGARVRPMHSGAGVTRHGVTDLRHGAGERRRRRTGAGGTWTGTDRRRRRSTITAITSSRIGTTGKTGGASGSSESGYRSRRCELAGRTVAARRRSATARRNLDSSVVRGHARRSAMFDNIAACELTASRTVTAASNRGA